MANDSGGAIAKGAAWMVAARLLDRLIGVVSTVVLARLLAPEDFGLVSMAVAVVALIELASAFGFEMSLVRNQNPTRAQYDTVWTLNVLFGLACGAMVCALAFPAAAYYNDDRLIGILVVLGASWTVGGLTNIGIVDFQRTLNFDKEFRFILARRLVGFVVTLSLAFVWRSYWALVAGTVASRLAGVVLSYGWHAYRPRLTLSAVREIFSFSAWVFVDKVASFGNARAADFVLGRLHGPVELGVFRLGEEIGHLPGTELVAPLNRALLPGVAQKVGRGEPVQRLAMTATGAVALLLMPACLGINAIAEPLVGLMLGSKWMAAIPIVQIMALNSLFMALSANHRTSLYAVGEARLPGLISIVRLLLFLPSVLLLTPELAAVGLALAAVVSSAAALVFGLGAGLRKLGVRGIEYLGVLWRPAFGSAVMWLAVRWVQMRIDGGGSWMLEAAHALVMICVGIAVYAGTVGLLYALCGRPAGAEKWVLERSAGLVSAFMTRFKS